MKKMFILCLTIAFLLALPQSAAAAQNASAAQNAEDDPGYDPLIRQSAYDAYEKVDSEESDVLLYAGKKRKIVAVGVDVWNGNGDIDWVKAKKAGDQIGRAHV